MREGLITYKTYAISLYYLFSFMYICVYMYICSGPLLMVLRSPCDAKILTRNF